MWRQTQMRWPDCPELKYAQPHALTRAEMGILSKQEAIGSLHHFNNGHFAKMIKSCHAHFDD
jgi:hypothetical protein